MTETSTATFESREQAIKEGGGTPESNLVKMWLTRIEASSREEKDWRKEAEESIAVYRCEDRVNSQTYFNILHSNIETIIPAIYNSTPVPDIRRRFNDPGMQTKNVANILERAISYSLDSYDFDGAVRSVLFDSYTAGRGVARVRYRPYIVPETMEEEGEAPESSDYESKEHADDISTPELGEIVAYEDVVCEYVPYAQFRRGPGRVWDDVSWVAFEHFLSRQQLEDLNDSVGKTVPLDSTVGDWNNATGSDGYRAEETPPQAEVFGRARVWEIWDRDTKKVLFIAPAHAAGPLLEEEDPLELESFFPTPRPVQPLMTPGNLVPMTPYKAYRRLSEELNDLTRRIQKITKQIRVRGMYANATQDIENVLNADDGELVPVPGLEAFLQGGGVDKAVAWWPIEPATKALAQLYQQREAVKQSIYEATGLSDILRGNTQASETATAQQIKSQWGSLRIQRMQADVARFVRDLFRIKAEIIATKFSKQTLQMMTGIAVSPDVEQILRSDLLRSYKIDIESDSTVRADLSRDKQEVSEFIQGIAAYVQSVGPAVQGGLVPKELALEIFASFARLQRLGKSAEDAIERAAEAVKSEAQQPQQQKPDPAMAKIQGELQIKAQQTQADLQSKNAELSMKAQSDERAAQMDAERMNREFELKARQMEMEHALKREDMLFQQNLRSQEHNAKMAVAAYGAVRDDERHQFDMANAANAQRQGEEKHRANLVSQKTKAAQKQVA